MIGIVADDLTGACDTAVQFRRAGFETCVHVGHGAVHVAKNEAPAPSHLPDVVAFNTESRHLPSDSARERVRAAAAALRAWGAWCVYKKIDSALRGPIAAELHEMLRAYPERTAVIAAAYPAQGRTTVDGRQLVHGVPVAESEFGADLLAPVRESHWRTLLTASGCFTKSDIVTVGLERLRGGSLEPSRRGNLTGAWPHARCVVFDAETGSDLERIAGWLIDRLDRVLLVGTAGLAGSLAARLTGHTRAHGAHLRKIKRVPPLPGYTRAHGAHPRTGQESRTGQEGRTGQKGRTGQEGCTGQEGRAARQGPTTRQGDALGVGRDLRAAPILVVSGSLKEISRRQIACLVAAGAGEVAVEPDGRSQPGRAMATEVQRLVDRAEEILGEGRDVVLSAPPAGSKAGPHSKPTSDRVTELLARSASQIMRRRRLRGLVLNGGDTALAVCTALGIDRLYLTRELLAGVVLARTGPGHFELTQPGSGQAELTRAEPAQPELTQLEPAPTTLTDTFRGPVVLKSGGFGAPETLIEILALLREGS